MSCVNIKSEEFKNTAKRLDLSSETLEMIVHEFQNTVGNEDTFPTDEYIQSKLLGKSYKLSIDQEELWNNRYSNPIVYDTIDEANAARREALNYFNEDSIVLYENNSGKYVLRVASPDFTDEYNEILKNAPRNSEGKLLVKPEGPVSNLDERQYAQVRTKAFKRWFGDWENDLDNASKVVDENGEPLVVYHESPNIFNVFDTSKKRYNVHEVNGIWASSVNRNGKGYGENIYPLFINLRNPIRTSIKQATNIIELRTLENKALKDNNSDGAILDTIDKFGYETQYYVKNSNQVKSATNNIGTFSTTNDRIDMMTEGYYTEDDLEYLLSRGLSIEDSFSGSINEQITKFKKAINKAVEEYNDKHHYDGGRKTTAKKKFSEKIKDDTAYFKFIESLSKKIISKLEKEGKTINIVPSKKLSSSMAVTMNGNTITLMYNPELVMADAERLDYIIAHELVHTVTSGAVNNVMDGTATKEEEEFVNSIWNIIKELNDKERFAWDFGFNLDTKEGRAKHIKEFIANVMTNPNMQSYLANIKTGAKQSLWSKFISAIKNLVSSYLGTNIEGSYLEELMNTISLHIDSKSSEFSSEDKATESLEEKITDTVNREIERLQKIIDNHNTVKRLIEQSILTHGITKLTLWDIKRYNRAYGTRVSLTLGMNKINTNVENLEQRLTEIKDPDYIKNEVQRIQKSILLRDAIARQEVIDKDLELLNREDYMTEGEIAKQAETSTEKSTEDSAVNTMTTRNQQLENLLNSTIVTASEVREIANQIAYAMSDLITDYLTNPKLLFENFPEKRTLNNEGEWSEELKDRDIKKVMSMPRVELMNFVGMDNIKALLRGKFDPKNSKYTSLSIIRKAKLISKNWEAIVALSKSTFNSLEGVEDKNADDFNGFEDSAEMEEAEGNLQEHWQEEMRTRDISKSLTQLVRNYLKQCYVLEYTGETDENGNRITKEKRDEFGIKLRVSEIDAIRSILRWGLGSRDLRELTAKLKEKSVENPWLNQLIDKLNPDATGLTEEDRYFQSQFWSVFNRNFQSYYVTKKDGGIVKLIPVNDSLTLRNTINEIESMFRLGNHPLFNVNRGINISKLEELESLYKTLQEKLKDKNIDASNNEEIINSLASILKTLGFRAEEDYIKRALLDNEFNKSLKSLEHIISTLRKNIENREYNPFNFHNKGESIVGYLKLFLSPYVSYIEDTSVNSFYDSGKMYQSYVLPSYLTKLMNKFNLSEEQFLEFIEEEYGKYPWFKFKRGGDISTGWRNPWLEQMVRNPMARKIFKHQVLLNHDGKLYMKNLSSSEYVLSVISAYFSGSSNSKGTEVPAWFRVPMLSNKPSAEFIRFYSQRGNNYKEVLLEGFNKMFGQEISRIQTVRRRNLSKSDPEYIKSFDENGKRFMLFDFMNDYLDGRQSTSRYGKILNTFIEEGADKVSKEDQVWFIDETKNIIKAEIDRIATETLTNWANSGVIEAAKNIEGLNEVNIEEQLINFIWNDKFAAMNILELTITDPAYYKDAEDLQKRFAQIHTPGIRPNIYAKDGNGREVTDGIHRAIILNDLEDFTSNVIDNISEVFDAKIRNASTEEEKLGLEALKDSIIRQFKEINVTDAQGYCSPTAYRKKAIMFGKWSKEQEEVYNRLRAGDFTYSDLKVAFQPLKPFIYSNVDTKVDAKDTPLDILKTGVQIKNSEYLLVLADAILRGTNTKKPNMLKVLFDVMEESQLTEETITNSKGEKKKQTVPAKNGIDTINFASTCKTGLHAIIDINQFLNMENGEEAAKQELRDAIYLEDGKYNTNTVYEMPYEDYAIPQEVPKHFLEHLQIMGSQARYLLIADLDPNAIFQVGDKPYLREGFIEEYENLIAENIEDAINNLAKELHLDSKSVKERNIAISKILQKECENPRYGIDLLQACSVDENGKFRVPLSDPIQAKRIEQMINSIIKNRVNKQEIAGGPVVQVSNYGLSEALNIRFKDKNGKLLATKQEFENNESLKSSYKSYNNYIENNQFGIAYFEVLAPFYLKDIFSNFSNKDGSIDIKAIENLTDKDGNKVGEELLKMIGYRIPTEATYSMAPLKIIGFLPKEAGEAIMLPYDITVITGSDYDIDKEYLMTKAYNIKKRDRKTLFGTIYDKLLKEYEKSTGKTASYALKSKIKDEINMFLDNPERLKYSSALSEKIWNIYKKEAFYVEMPTDGKEARDNMLIDMFYSVLTHKSSAAKMLNPGGFEEQKRMGYIVEALRNPSNKYNYEKLLALDTGTLKKISYKPKNLTDIQDHVQFYKQNSAAAVLIGIFAVNNIAHAVYQSGKTPLYIDIAESCQYDEPFTIAGVEFGGNMMIDPTYDIEGNLITKSLGSLIASSVDAAKDPVLNLMNINSKTAPILTTLIRLGMPFKSAALFLSQKAVSDILSEYEESSLSKPKSLSSIIDERIKNLESDESIDEDFEFSKEELTLEELIKGVKSSSNIKAYYKTLRALSYIMKISEDMESTTLVSRFNSINNAVGPLIIDNLIVEDKINNFSENFRTRTEDGSYIQIGIDAILHDHPILNGFYKSFNIAKGIFLDLNMVSNSHSFRNIVFNELFGGRVHNAIFSNRKLLSKLSDFYQSYLLMAAGVIDESKLSYYIKTFPSNFIKNNIKEKYPENKLIQSISYTVDKKTERVSLELKTTGMTTAEKEELSSAWVDLYKKDKTLALELFEYNFFRGGIAFSPKTFMGLLPTYIKDRIEGYYEAYSLNPMVDENIVMDQFIRNNWTNDTLVPYKSIKKNNGRFGSDDTITFFTEEALKNMDGIIYFKASTRDSVSLYKLESRTKKSAIYKPIEPLGGNGEYLEISTENIERRVRKIDSSTETLQSEEADSTEIEDKMPDEDSLTPKEKEFRDLMYKAITASRDTVSAENYRRNYKNFSDSDKKLYEKGMKKYLNDELSKQGYELNEEEINEIYKQFCK